MEKINKILKKSLILVIVFMTLISYSYPTIVFGNNGWTYDFGADRGGKYKDYKYDEIPTNEPTLNQLRGDIAYEGVIMQAYAINELLKDGVLLYETGQVRNPDWPLEPGAPQFISDEKYTLKTKDSGEEVIDLIKEKIEEMKKGSVVVRDYAISKLDINLEAWKAKIKLETPPCLYLVDAQAFAKEEKDKINPPSGNSALDVVDKIEEDNKQASEGNNSGDGEDEADGGILLEPLFALVNLVADTITSFLGEFMIGGDGLEGYYFESGKEQLKPANAATLTKDDVYRVSTKSFKFGTSYYDIRYTPEKIFSGEVPILSVDFISGQAPKLDENGDVVRDGNGDIIYDDNSNSDWMSIRKVISDWYKVLRMIAIIGLLSVLIYTGIKILISANAKDKAKYKEWIINWFIAVAILFSMHYIMSFINSVTNEISQLLSDSCRDIVVEEVSSTSEKDKEGVNPNNVFTTNLMGLVRYMVRSGNFKIKVGYEIMYIALITYTIKFTFIYLKRVLNMAFLTLIAPIVALTYPLDKINDGQAQGFNMWIKEYIFNALLQPMHLILYYILVGSSVGIAASNPLYGIVVLMFMTEAEKLLKKIFGFDKAGAGTVGGMAGAFAAGAIASNIKNIAKMSKLGGGNGGKDGPGLPKNDEIDNIKPVDDPSSMSAFGESPTPPVIGSGENTSAEGEGANTIVGRNGAIITNGAGSNGNTVTNTQRDPQVVANRSGEGTQPDGSNFDADSEYLKKLEEERTQDHWTNGDEKTYQQMKKEHEEKLRAQSGQNSSKVTNPSTDPARDLAKKKETTRLERFGKGMTAVGKSLARPIYDFDRSGKYNAKRWGRRILRAGIGGAVGITAAAVQAGISITDGKYNPMEGMATFTAGYAGGGQIFKGLEGLKDTYYEGANAGDKEAQLKRAKSRYADRDDVIAYNKKNYAGREKEVMQRQRDNWMRYGYTDPKEMKSGIKYADAWIKQTYGDSFNNMSEADKERIWKYADNRAAQAMSFKERLKDQNQSKAIWNDEKREKYIEQMVMHEAAPGASEADKQKIRAKYQEAFKAVREYDDAQ